MTLSPYGCVGARGAVLPGSLGAGRGGEIGRGLGFIVPPGAGPPDSGTGSPGAGGVGVLLTHNS